MQHKSLYLRKQTSNNCTFIYLPWRIVKQQLIYAERHLAITGIITVLPPIFRSSSQPAANFFVRSTLSSQHTKREAKVGLQSSVYLSQIYTEGLYIASNQKYYEQDNYFSEAFSQGVAKNIDFSITAIFGLSCFYVFIKDIINFQLLVRFTFYQFKFRQR